MSEIQTEPTSANHTVAESPHVESTVDCQTWLYLSGGGIRCALGSLGAIHYLDKGEKADAHAGRLTRISSVSGGSLENALLSHAGADQKAHYPLAFRRFTTHGLPHHFLRTFAVAGLIVALFLAVRGPWSIVDTSGVGAVLENVGLAIGALAGAQLLLTAYARDRMRRIVAPAHREPSASVPPTRLHIFCASDIRSGMPTYIFRGGSRTVVAHDRSSDVGQIDYFDAAKISLADMTFASAAWPGLTLPLRRRLLRHDPGEQRIGVFTTTQKKPSREEHTITRPLRKRFSLLDGGLSGTLASNVDPELLGDHTSCGLMSHIEMSSDQRNEVPIHRIVVDGGKYPERTPTWPFSTVPGPSALVALIKGIKVSLDSKLSGDRRLVGQQADVSYVSVTGHGRVFHVPRLDKTGVVRVHAPIPPTRSRRRGALFGRSTREALDSVQIPAGQEDQVPPSAADIVRLLDDLRYRADQVGNFRGIKKHGAACAASGVAGMYAELARETADADGIVAALRDFERAIHQAGALDDVVDRFEKPRPGGLRWTELVELGGRASADEPVAISHRGTNRGNSAASFRSAIAAGSKVLECDLQLTKDGELVALHGAFGFVRVGRFRWVRCVSRTRDALQQELGDLDSVSELLEQFVDHDVAWNFEAKRSATMDRLLRQLGESSNELTRSPIVSAGWRRSVIQRARLHDPNRLTAASATEIVRLWFGRRVNHVAVVQVPTWPGFRRVARVATGQGIHVQFFGANNRRTVRRLAKRFKGAGFITDELDDIISVLADVDP